MEIYNCKVLVGGSRSNEVRKEGIPAAEITMLRHLHGEDSILDIKHVGSSPITNAEVRDLLSLSYGPGDVDMTKAGPAILKEVFGPAGVLLPTVVDGVPLRKTKKDIAPVEVKRLRDMRPEDDVQPVMAEAFDD